ncbi:hypothetical protein evm_000561 [Chilo suppressalis]|nr:hypothetical protein evm_000561 [Chilo suppressalis]
MDILKILFVMFLAFAGVCWGFEKRIKVDPFRPVPPPNPDQVTNVLLLQALRNPTRTNPILAAANERTTN